MEADRKLAFPVEGLQSLAEFPFVRALFERRSRRFAVGATLPDGPLAFSSPNPPLPLSDVEELLLLAAMTGNTGWHYGIMRHARYAPELANYNGGAGGRTFPSAAGFHTAEVFFTNDTGSYFCPTRDSGALVAPGASPEEVVEAIRGRIQRLSHARIAIPNEEPYMEGHNTWIANTPGSTLYFPVGDVAQHNLLNLCFYAQNGYCIFDDISKKPIEGIERFGDLVDLENPVPLTFLELYTITELTAEISTSAYNGALMLQAMGLGGWMFDGLDMWTVLGASGNPDVPGLGFRYDTDPRWSLANPTGLEGVFEAFCPPHYSSMRAAVEALVERKFGSGGPYNPTTPGPWKDAARVRGAAAVHDEHFIDCVATQAQHIYDTFGKFPGTVPSLYIMMFLQAQHLELAFYDTHFAPGAYLDTHAEHMRRWHPEHDL